MKIAELPPLKVRVHLYLKNIRNWSKILPCSFSVSLCISRESRVVSRYIIVFSFRFFKKGSCQLLAKVCARSTG